MEKIPLTYTKSFFIGMCLSRRLLKLTLYVYTTVIFMLMFNRRAVDTESSFFEFSYMIIKNYAMFFFFLLSLDGIVALKNYFRWIISSINTRSFEVDYEDFFPAKRLNMLIGFKTSMVLMYFCVSIWLLFTPFTLIGFTISSSELVTVFFGYLHIEHPIRLYLILIVVYLLSKRWYIKYFHRLFRYFLKNNFNEVNQNENIQTYFNNYYRYLFKKEIFLSTVTLRGGTGYRNENHVQEVATIFQNEISCFLIGGSEEIMLNYEVFELDNWIPYSVIQTETTYRGLKYEVIEPNLKEMVWESRW